MLLPDEINELLGQIDYKDWQFHLIVDQGKMSIQARFFDRCADTGDTIMQYGRKWQISKHMTKSEVLQTALKAVLTAEEHEAREKFTWRGRAIFGPHIDIEALWQLSGITDAREAV